MVVVRLIPYLVWKYNVRGVNRLTNVPTGKTLAERFTELEIRISDLEKASSKKK